MGLGEDFHYGIDVGLRRRDDGPRGDDESEASLGKLAGGTQVFFGRNYKTTSRFHPLPDHIPQILLNRPLHRTSPQSLSDPLPDEHLDGFLIDRQINPHLSVPIDR